jgi:uncharacterized membrane protein YkvA (DUF1232 family)
MTRSDDFDDSDARRQFDDYSRKATPGDVELVLEHEEQIFAKADKGPLAKFIGTIRDLMQMIAAYSNGSYREVPWSTIAAAVGALVYVLSPIDAIPDFIPGLGLVDDAAVLAVAMKMIGSDVAAFVAWRERSDG